MHVAPRGQITSILVASSPGGMVSAQLLARLQQSAVIVTIATTVVILGEMTLSVCLCSVLYGTTRCSPCLAVCGAAQGEEQEGGGGGEEEEGAYPCICCSGCVSRSYAATYHEYRNHIIMRACVRVRMCAAWSEAECSEVRWRLGIGTRAVTIV